MVAGEMTTSAPARLNFSTFSRSVAAATIRTSESSWRTVSTAVNMGMPLAQSVPKAKVRQAYVEMAAMIRAALTAGSGEDAAGHGQANSRKGAGLFSKIFS